MAPEQARADALDERTDVYGLGAILFEILTGRPPHAGAPAEELLGRVAAGPSPRPRDVRADVPESLDLLCARAMAHDPAERFATAAALVAELEAWLADEPVLTYRAIVAGFARLVEANPASVTYLDQLARSRLTLGLVLDGIGRPAPAEAAFREAIADYERLNAMDGAQPHHRADLATARSHLARVLNAQGRPVKAARMMREAIADYEQYARLHPPAGDETVGIVDVYLTLTEAPVGPAAPADAGAARVPSTPSETGEHAAPPPPAEDAEASADETLQMRLTMLQPIAHGGMGQVLAAYDPALRRDVVVKQLGRGRLNDERSLRRFLREAQITAQLEHPGVVPVYGLGRRAGTGEPYLAMRRVTGRDLQQAIADHHHARRAGEPPPGPPKALLAAFVKACETIAYAHARGIVHRDLKPGNILLGEYGDVVVLDWGLAMRVASTGRAVDVLEEVDEGLTMAGTVVGTPAYMAPEQVRGEKTADPRLDVYALGATLFTILTGTHPFGSRDMRELLVAIAAAKRPPSAREANPRVPAALDAIAARAMARDPADRYPTADALGRDVQAWLVGDRVSAAGEPWLARVARRLAWVTSPAGRSG
jgi:serine/threonine protein kinase